MYSVREDMLRMRKARRICSRRGVVVVTMNDLLSVRSDQWITLAAAGTGGRNGSGLGRIAQLREARRVAASFNSQLHRTRTAALLSTEIHRSSRRGSGR